MKIFYFTATGNSLYIAKRIGGELYSIPQMIKEGKFDFEDDAIGFVFPCHGWGVARLIRRFIKRSKFNANYFFAIMTYGGTPKSGLQNMEQIGSKAGIQFNYTNEIFMIDNYLPNFEMEDEIKKEESKKIEEKLSLIIADVKIRKNRLVRKGCASVLLSKGGRCLSDKLSYNSGKKFIIKIIATVVKYVQKFVLPRILRFKESLVFLVTVKCALLAYIIVLRMQYI
jgi:flavodoxin